jgi:O-antigen ligase
LNYRHAINPSPGAAAVRQLTSPGVGVRRWKSLALVFLILNGLQAFGFLDRVVYGEWYGKTGDRFTELLNLLFIIIGGLLFVSGLPRLPGIRTGAVLAVGLVALFFCSAVWSIEPGFSAKQAVEYLSVICAAFGIVTNFDADEYMDWLGFLAFGAACLSLTLLVAFPSSVIAPGLGDFRGIFSQKNVLGEAMTMGSLALLHGIRRGGKRPFLKVAFLCVVAMAAVKSASATSCMIILVFCLTDVVMFQYRKGGAARIVAQAMMVLAVPAVIAVLLFPDVLLQLIGKDPTLTGRTDIWSFVIIDIFQRPILGWGYRAFWSFNNPAALEISNALKWSVPQAHNGLLEILLDVGFVGAAFVLSILVRTMLIAIKCIRRADRVMGITCFLSGIGIIVVGVSEAVLLNSFEASTSVFFVTGFFCEQAVRSAGAGFGRTNFNGHEKRRWV